MCISYTCILYIIYYIFGTNFVFSLKFAKSWRQMFSLVRLWYIRTECIWNALVWKTVMLYSTPQCLNQQALPFLRVTSQPTAASPYVSWNIVCVFYLNRRAALTVQLTTVLSRVLAGRSKNTVVTSVPQMHLLNAEIHVSTKGQNLTLYVPFLSLHCMIL